MSRPPEVLLAESAYLTPNQQRFRANGAPALRYSLPRSVWLNHNYSVLPAEKRIPIARRGQEPWYSYHQVVRRGVNPRGRRWIRIESGGTMSNCRRRRSI